MAFDGRHPCKALVATLAGVALIIGAAGCGPSSRSVTTSSGKPTAGVPSACGDLGGTLGPEHICKVHDSAADYTIDLSFPVDYPEQQTVTDYLKRKRGDFVDFAKQFPPASRATPYSLDVEGERYRSGTPTSGTQSVVFAVDDDEGIAHEGHPDTSYDVFNYDLGERAPITLDTLFTPGTNPVDVLSPIAEPILAKRFGAELIPALRAAGANAYRNFAITDDAVIFFFGESQLRVSNSGPFQISLARNQFESALAIPPSS